MQVDNKPKRSMQETHYLTDLLKAGPLDDSANRFLLWEAKRYRIGQIDNELRELAATPPAMKDLKKYAEEGYAGYYQRMVKRTAFYIQNNAKSHAEARNCFVRLDEHDVTRQIIVLPWHAVEDALKLLEEQGWAGLSDADRKKKTTALQAEREKLNAECEDQMPKALYYRNHFQNGGLVNIAEIVFNDWRELQRWTVDVCDPKGRALQYADEATQRAHAVLNLSQLRLSKARLYAWTPTPTLA